MVSGYFFSLGVLSSGSIHKIFFYFVLQVICIFIFSSIFYFIVSEYSLVSKLGLLEGGHQGLINQFNKIRIEPLHFLLSGSEIHLWFFSSLLSGISVLYLFLISRLKKILMICSLFLYVLGLLAGSYVSTPVGIDFSFDSRTGPFFSSVYIALGWWLANYQGDILTKTALLFLLYGFLISITEAFILEKCFNVFAEGQSYLFGTIIFSTGFFLMALAKPSFGNWSLLEYWGKYTLGVYVIHLAILNSPLTDWTNPYISEQLRQYTLPFVVYFIVLILVIFTYQCISVFLNCLGRSRFNSLYLKLIKYLQHETIFQIIKFGIVGLSATLIHVSSYVFMIEAKLAEPLMANFIAYVFAFFLSFLGHFHWTFNNKNSLNWKKSFAKFMITSSIGLVLNTLAVFIIVNSLGLNYLYSVVIMVTLVPASMFLINKIWSFA